MPVHLKMREVIGALMVGTFEALEMDPLVCFSHISGLWLLPRGQEFVTFYFGFAEQMEVTLFQRSRGNLVRATFL